MGLVHAFLTVLHRNSSDLLTTLNPADRKHLKMTLISDEFLPKTEQVKQTIDFSRCDNSKGLMRTITCANQLRKSNCPELALSKFSRERDQDLLRIPENLNG